MGRTLDINEFLPSDFLKEFYSSNLYEQSVQSEKESLFTRKRTQTQLTQTEIL